MSGTNLILIILIPIIFIILGSALSLLFIRFSLIKTRVGKGSVIFKLDLYSRKISLLHSNRKKSILERGIHSKNWMPIKAINRQFVGNVAKNKIREALNVVSKNNKHHVIHFESKVTLNSKKNNYLFSISFSPMEDDSDFIMRISWRKSNVSDANNKKNGTYTTQEAIIKNDSLAKGFIAFNLKSDYVNGDIKLSNLLSSITKKPLTFYRNNDILIVVFYAPNIALVKKYIDTFISRVENIGYKKGAKSFYKGSGFISLKNIGTNIKFLQVMRALEFFIILSINKNEPFISNQNDNFITDDYKKYASASKVFRTAIRTGDLQTKLIPVRSRKSNRVIMNYAIPKIENLNNNMLSELLVNKNNGIELTNAYAKLVGINKKVASPVLLDVNSHWLIENASKLKFKKAVYTIDIRQGTEYDELKNCIISLSKLGIVFALRIRSFSEAIVTLIKKTSPQFILIDGAAWNKFGIKSSDTYISLLSIKELADAEKIKLIFESPSRLVDNNTANKIGLNFFYHL